MINETFIGSDVIIDLFTDRIHLQIQHRKNDWLTKPIM